MKKRKHHAKGNIQPQPKDKDLQGEGNYDATRRYNAATERFVKSGKVDEAAHAAAPKSPQEEAEMKSAEREGLSRAKDLEHPDEMVDAADAAELAMEKDRRTRDAHGRDTTPANRR